MNLVADSVHRVLEQGEANSVHRAGQCANIDDADWLQIGAAASPHSAAALPASSNSGWMHVPLSLVAALDTLAVVWCLNFLFCWCKLFISEDLKYLRSSGMILFRYY